jgi:hypothetical protein
MNPNHIDLPGTPVELEGEIVGYIPKKETSDPFGNRWENHPSSVENQIKDEPTVKYGTTATEKLKSEYPHIYSGYMAIVEEQLELFSKKHLDYGMSNISAGTLLQTEDERAFALTGLWYRISDKISRWKNLLINNKQINNEPLTDTYQDIVNYGIIAQLVERGLWKK